MALKLYNTLTRSKEEFKPINPPQVTFYNCGPTVYDVFHVGNARNFVFADTLRRYMASSGYEVKFVQNLTDVDDKIINRANEEGKTAEQVAIENTELYFKFADALGVQRADVHPKATEHIDEMIEMVERLMEKGHAYENEGDVYFRVSSYEEHGRLSRRKVEDMLEGDRVSEEIKRRKESPADFALWKAAKPDEPSWDSPWGKGRPGWHLECSVMSIKHLGETIDIHSGGADLAFPHHENEIAQSCCYTATDDHKPEFVNYWVHNGFITFGESQTTSDDNFTDDAAAAKISKSKMTAEQKDLFNIDKALGRFGAPALRYFLVSAHYRSPLVFSIETVEDAGRRVEKIQHAINTAQQFLQANSSKLESGENESPLPNAQIEKLRQQFTEVMDDDLNTALALAVISDGITLMNTLRNAFDKNEGAPIEQNELLYTLSDLQKLTEQLASQLAILGLDDIGSDDADVDDAGEVDAVIRLLIDVRQQARKSRAFDLADSIRDDLAKSNIMLEDGASGTTYNQEGGAPPFSELMLLTIDVRQAARAAKNFELSDQIRDGLGELSIVLEDGASGTTWKKS